MRQEKNPAPTAYGEWYRQGSELARGGKWSEALVFYERCIQVHPNGIEAWHEKAMALNRLGRHEEALEAFERVIELRVKHEVTEYGGMNLLGRWGKRASRSPSGSPRSKGQK